MRAHGKILLLACIILAACVSVASADHIGYTSAGGIVPVLFEDNHNTCEELGCPGTTYDIDKTSGYTGTYPLGSSGTITITSDDKIIAWSSDVDINCIALKAGNGGDLYCYDPPARSDARLSTPLNTNGDVLQPRDISHITICYDTDTAVPEFPALFLPVIMIIGVLGVVLFIQKTREH
jgi:hypothetical protein